jgi:carboxylate-amine ligase
VEHHFRDDDYPIGVEEELMILDRQTLDLRSEIESLLAESDDDSVSPELMESVLEIQTSKCANVAQAREELAALRGDLANRAGERGLVIGASATHPFALWERQKIVARPRYRELTARLGFVARQELVFGMHVHVGVGDPEQAIRVANGMREHVPLLVALSTNSPFWCGIDTGLESSRVPIFRTFPRVGIPPRFADWQEYCERLEFLCTSGLVEDYTFVWWDVRPHPSLGTVEIRAMDVQTSLDATTALAALVQCLAREAACAASVPDTRPEVLDENKWLAARYGLRAELADGVSGERRSAREQTVRTVERLGAHAEELGCTAELERVGAILQGGTGAARQRGVHATNPDLRELTADIVSRT